MQQFHTDVNLSDQFNKDNLLAMLPAILNQRVGSNNQKLLNIFADLANQTKNNLINIYNQRFLENATGQQIDDIAADFGITRLDNDDEFLKLEVRAKIMQNIFGRNLNDFKRYIAFVFNIQINQFEVETDNNQTDSQGNVYNPEQLMITNLPINLLNGTNLTAKKKIINNFITDFLPPEYLISDIRYAKDSNLSLFQGAITEKTRVRNSQIDN